VTLANNVPSLGIFAFPVHNTPLSSAVTLKNASFLAQLVFLVEQSQLQPATPSLNVRRKSPVAHASITIVNILMKPAVSLTFLAAGLAMLATLAKPIRLLIVIRSITAG
jgi:hypothetical protein